MLLLRGCGASTALAIVACAAWSFGGALAATQVVLLVASAVSMLFALAVLLLDDGNRVRLPALLVPLLGALGLGLLQLAPLQRGLAVTLSPATVAGRDRLVDPVAPRHDAISVYPEATRQQLGLVVLGTSMVVAGAVFFRTPRAHAILWGTLAVIGGTIGLFELSQRLRHGPGWQQLWSADSPLGPFINHNHSGAFLGLCLAGTVAWALGAPRCAARKECRLAIALLAALILAAIIAGLSRSAFLSTTSAGLVLLAIRARQPGRRWRLVLAAGVVSIAWALVAWIGLAPVAGARLATLFDAARVPSIRLPNWRDGLATLPDFWRCGAGWGGYRYVYPARQQRYDRDWYFHAENEFLEALVDGGVPGFALLVAALVLSIRCAWRLARDSHSGGYPFGLAGMFALAGQGVHAGFDFALHLPAIVCALGLVCGAISALATTPSAPPSSPAGSRHRLAVGTAVGIVLLLAASCGWAAQRAATAAAIAACMARTPVDAVSPATAVADLTAARDQMETLLPRMPEDAEAQYYTALLYVGLFRVQSLEQARRETAFESEGAAWREASPFEVHRRVCELAQAGETAAWNTLRAAPRIQATLLPALRHARLAAAACPWMPEAHLLIGQLCGLEEFPPATRTHCARARSLAPSNTDVHLRCGLLEIQAGAARQACRDWRRCLDLAGTLEVEVLQEILDRAAQCMPEADALRAILPDNPALLARVAGQRYSRPEQSQLRQVLMQRIAALAGNDAFSSAGYIPAARKGAP